MENLLEMRMDGEIGKDEYLRLKRETDEKLIESNNQLLSFRKDCDRIDTLNQKLDKMKATMEQMIDFSKETVPREILKFHWIFNLLGDDNKFSCNVEGRKNAPIFSEFEKVLPIFAPSTGGYQSRVGGNIKEWFE